MRVSRVLKDGGRLHATITPKPVWNQQQHESKNYKEPQRSTGFQTRTTAGPGLSLKCFKVQYHINIKVQGNHLQWYYGRHQITSVFRHKNKQTTHGPAYAGLVLLHTDSVTVFYANMLISTQMELSTKCCCLCECIYLFIYFIKRHCNSFFNIPQFELRYQPKCRAAFY